MKTLLISRRYLPDMTLGQAFMDNFECWTMERPWLGNEPFKSCVPEGVYFANRIKDSSKTNGRETFELENVEGRTDIQIHPGNFVDETEGCILPGQPPQVIQGKYGVPSSSNTFDELMKFLDGVDRIKVIIRKH